MLSTLKSTFLASLPLLLTACATPPRTVDHVDLTRYAGTWYEIARLPNWFESGCTAATATYSPRSDGTLNVVNQCRDGSPSGKKQEIQGIARVVDPATNAKLKVMFQWPVEGDYWILRLNDDYTTAAVGSPDRKTLWILHRSPTIDPSEYQHLLQSLEADKLPTRKLERTLQ